MANRISMARMQADKARIRELFDPPATNRRQMQIIYQALHTVIAADLTPRQREMVVMHYFDKKSVTQIAAELHVNPSTVTRTLQRAGNRIRKNMRFYFDFRGLVREDDD